MNSPEDRNHDLTERYLRGELTAEELDAFESHLRADASARAAFRRVMRLDANLRNRGAELNPELAVWSGTVPAVSRPVVSAWFGWLWARPLGSFAAAALAILAVVGWWVWQSASGGGAFATLARSEGAEFAVGSAALRDGMPLRGERVRLERGTLALVTRLGVQVEMSSPAEFAFESAERMRLFQGRLSADVGERGKGFTVITNAGEVVDLGTRFGIEVTEAGATDVVVFEGTVKVRADQSAEAGTRPWTTLNTGDAVRLPGRRREMQRLARIQFSEKAEDWSVAEPAASGVVGDVRDNVMEAQFHRYFGVLPGGMTAGARPFSDQPGASWQAAPGESFPAWLEGADLVRTFSADRHDAALEITLTLHHPCIVYVLLDLRKEPPGWLKRGFADTGARLRVGPWKPPGIGDGLPPDAEGRRYALCAVWKCEVPTPGALRLGPPHRAGHGGPSTMYGLAARALPIGEFPAPPQVAPTPSPIRKRP